jgi:hypothetical protein
MSRIAFSLLALLAAAGCSGRDIAGPMSSDLQPAFSASFPRSGALHITKECSQYTRLAGGFCTITSSNLEAIPAGTRVIYALAAGATGLDTDVMLDPPGPGNNVAFGHVVLDLVSGQGVVTISGGTGKFTWLEASVVVSRLVRPNWAWEGTYSFDPRE